MVYRVPERERKISDAIGTWEENITSPSILSTFSPRDLINRTLSTNLIARPVLNIAQITRAVVGVLSSKPGGRIHDLVEATRFILEQKKEFNKARFEKIKENLGVR